MSKQERSHNLSVPGPQLHERKRPTSELKILSNRQNAQKSTGPKTRRGKSYSRKNSFKHGFFAKVLSRIVGLSEEELLDFEQLWDGLYEHWQPIGPSEEEEVTYIAENLLKRRRMARYRRC
jgi:hypothetical protein